MEILHVLLPKDGMVSHVWNLLALQDPGITVLNVSVPTQAKDVCLGNFSTEFNVYTINTLVQLEQLGVVPHVLPHLHNVL